MAKSNTSLSGNYYFVGGLINGSSSYGLSVVNPCDGGTISLGSEGDIANLISRFQIPKSGTGHNIEITVNILESGTSTVLDTKDLRFTYLPVTTAGDDTQNVLQFLGASLQYKSTGYTLQSTLDIVAVTLDISYDNDSEKYTIVVGTVESMTDGKYKIGPA